MPATNTSSKPKSLYAEVGKNYAPSAPLKELAQRKPNWSPDELSAALKKKYDEYIKRDYQAWIELLEQGRMIANLTSGKLLTLRNRVSGRWMMVARTDARFSDNKSVAGQFQFYITKLESEWLSSKPALEAICPSDDDQIEEFIDAVNIVENHYTQKFYDTDYETKEFKSAAEYGTWLTRYRFDVDTNDLVCESLNFPACRWDMRYRAEESPYFIYQSKCSSAVLAELLDGEINSDGNADYDNYGLTIIDQISHQGGNVAGEGKNNPYGNYDMVKGENVVTEMWLQPEAYCDIVLSAPEDSVDGGKIPKRLIDMFPNGLCAVGINGMKTIIQLHAENHKDHIVSGLYHVQSFSGIGKGVSDAVDAVKELNDLHSQLLAHTKAHSMPGFGFNSAMLSEADARAVGQPRRNIAIDFTNAPDGVHDVNQVISAIVPGQAAQGAFEMREKLKEDVQIAFQSVDFSDGLPGVNNDTATGAKIGDANAASLLVPQHLRKALSRKRGAALIYNLFRKYKSNKPMFFATKNINGITAYKTFDSSLFEKEVDIDFEVVSNSQIPVKPFANRDATTQLLTATGGVGGLIQALQMNPEITADIANTYGATLPIPKKNDIARVCRQRIQQAKKLLGMELQLQGMMASVTGQQANDPNLADKIVSQLTPPIHPKEPFHQSKVQFLAELLDTDEMMFAPNELREVIGCMIDRHISEQQLATMQVQQDQNAADIMSNLPMLLGSEAMSQNAQKMQQAYEQQQAQAQAQQEQQTAMVQGAAQIAQQSAQAQIEHHSAQASHQQALAQADQAHAQSTALANQQHVQTLQQQQNQAAIDAQSQSRDQEHDLQTQALSHLATIAAAKESAKAKTGVAK